MENPWKEFVKKMDDDNLVLEKEKLLISEFNFTTKEEYRIHTNIAPAPFMGNFENAEILILMLNPGFDEKENERKFYSEYKSYWLNEIQRKKSSTYSLFCLEERYCEYSDYWLNKLMPLINVSSKEKISEKICKIQFFPYHSKKYKKIPIRLLKKHNFDKYLPSQLYNFEIVKKAMERNAIIIIPRAKKQWFEAIKELPDYQKKYSTNSYQNIILSEKNLSTETFEILKAKLNS